MALDVTGIEGLPLVRPGDDLCAVLLDAINAQMSLCDGDVLVIAQKIVSKAEGRLVRLDDVSPSHDAAALAAETEKDPRLVQLILDECIAVVRKRPGVLIVRHRLGFVSANAGIDQSNVDQGCGEVALLLPLDPDATAATLHARILEETGKRVGVIISDSANRPWRLGTTAIAIGAAGFQVFDDRRGDFRPVRARTQDHARQPRRQHRDGRRSRDGRDDRAYSGGAGQGLSAGVTGRQRGRDQSTAERRPVPMNAPESDSA